MNNENSIAFRTITPIWQFRIQDDTLYEGVFKYEGNLVEKNLKYFIHGKHFDFSSYSPSDLDFLFLNEEDPLLLSYIQSLLSRGFFRPEAYFLIIDFIYSFSSQEEMNNSKLSKSSNTTETVLITDSILQSFNLNSTS